LVSSGLLDEESDQTLREAVDQEIEDAISYADAAPSPDPATALDGVYAP
jgi:TPP-dependent pyruvate/acetoin dehydrogenase alpha subunit